MTADLHVRVDRAGGISVRSDATIHVPSKQFTRRTTMVMKWIACLALAGLMLVGLPGCGRAYEGPSSEMPPAGEASTQAGDSGAAFADKPAEAAEDASRAATRERKIIYNTSIELVVEDYQEFEKQIAQLVEQYGGFVAQAETRRRYSDRQSGTWTIRVPVDQYARFLTSVTSLGFAESRRENAQDVTEEFVDIEARVRNKRELESRIITMLEERTGKLADVLEIERELSRVREEIEVMEGRLRYLSDRTSLATITISCREEEKYTPPEAPTFRSRISRSWRGSLGALTTTGENLLVALVATVPWLLALGLPAALVGVAIRRNRSRSEK